MIHFAAKRDGKQSSIPRPSSAELRYDSFDNHNLSIWTCPSLQYLRTSSAGFLSPVKRRVQYLPQRHVQRWHRYLHCPWIKNQSLPRRRHRQQLYHNSARMGHLHPRLHLNGLATKEPPSVPTASNRYPQLALT